MPRSDVIEERKVVQPGKVRTIEYEIDAADTTVRVEFARDNGVTVDLDPIDPWPVRIGRDQRVLEVLCEVSYDGGQSWAFGGACSINGGIHHHDRGELLRTSWAAWELHPQRDRQTPRRCRLTIDVFLPLNTRVTFAANDEIKRGVLIGNPGRRG